MIYQALSNVFSFFKWMKILWKHLERDLDAFFSLWLILSFFNVGNENYCFKSLILKTLFHFKAKNWMWVSMGFIGFSAKKGYEGCFWSWSDCGGTMVSQSWLIGTGTGSPAMLSSWCPDGVDSPWLCHLMGDQKRLHPDVYSYKEIYSIDHQYICIVKKLLVFFCFAFDEVETRFDDSRFIPQIYLSQTRDCHSHSR